MEQPPQTLPPRFYTEQFWKELAEEWRGKVTDLTSSGICFQASKKLCSERGYYWKVCSFMAQYAPEHIKDKTDYFFPISNPESRALRAALCERIAADMKRLYGNTTTPTSIWRTPKFWRELAKEWRGPETFATREGICWQLVCAFQGYGESMEARLFLEKFRPAHAKAFFFPIADEFRHLRAALCDKIADHLENEANQTQRPTQGQIQPLLSDLR